MDCKKADNLLIDYLYGELSPSDRAAFEQHLQGCEQHAREVEKLRGVLNLVRAQEPEEVPEAVSARILQTARAQMPQKPKPSPFLTLIWNPVAAAAVLVVVVITVGLATHFMSEPAPKEDTAIEAARPLTLAEEPAERPALAVKAEEKKEFAPTPEPKLAERPPAAEPAKKVYKKKPRRKRRKSPAKRKGLKSMPAPSPKSPEVWGTRAKPKPSAATGARGGAAGPGDAAVGGKTTSAIGKVDRAKDKKKKEKKISRPREEREFAKPPPPAKAAPAPPAPTIEEGVMEAEAAPVSMDMEDESYSQAPAPRAKKAAERAPSDYYRSAEADLANKRYGAAVTKYQKFLARNPSDPRAPTCRYRIAKALFLAGRCAEAVDAVETAVAASPRHPMAPNALLDQASCYERLNRLSEANATYRRIEGNYPTYKEEARRGIRRTRRETDVKPAATEQHR